MKGVFVDWFVLSWIVFIVLCKPIFKNYILFLFQGLGSQKNNIINPFFAYLYICWQWWLEWMEGVGFNKIHLTGLHPVLDQSWASQSNFNKFNPVHQKWFKNIFFYQPH